MSLAARKPPSRALLVTSCPQRFEQLTAAEGALILPRPVWGWTILDALRTPVDREAPAKKESARAR